MTRYLIYHCSTTANQAFTHFSLNSFKFLGHAITFNRNEKPAEKQHTVSSAYYAIAFYDKNIFAALVQKYALKNQDRLNQKHITELNEDGFIWFL